MKTFINFVVCILSGLYLESVQAQNAVEAKFIPLGESHASDVGPLCFSPDGEYLLAANKNGSIEMWSVRERRRLKTFQSELKEIRSVGFLIGKNQVCGIYREGTLIWDLVSGMQIGKQANSWFPLYSISGQYKLEYPGGTNVYYNITDTYSNQYTGKVKGVPELSPNGRYALSHYTEYGFERTVVTQLSSGEVIFNRKDKGFELNSFSSDSRFIIEISGEKIRLWEITTGKVFRTIDLGEPVIAVHTNTKGHELIAITKSTNPKLVNIQTGEVIRSFKGYFGSSREVAFSPDDKIIVNGGKQLTFWETSTGLQLDYKGIDGSGKLPPGQNIPQDTKPFPTFSQLIWLAQPITVHEPAFTAKAVVVSSAPNAISREHIRVYLNGQPIATGQKLDNVTLVKQSQQGLYDWRQTLPLREGENEIVLGLTLPGQPEVRSEPLRVTYLPPAKPNLYVLAIGVPGGGLQYAPQDAEQVGQLLKKQSASLFNQVKVTYLNRPGQVQATQLKNEVEVLRGLDITPNDVLLLFVSSHGKRLNLRNGKSDFAILPEDYDSRTSKTEENTTLLYKGDILESLSQLSCKKLVLLDACYSGNADPGSKARFLDDLREAQEIVKQTPAGLITLTSSGNTQSWEDPAWQHGAFTKALLDGLNGAADTNKDHFVQVSELFQYLQKTVPSLVRQRKNQEQQPQMYPADLPAERDFPLVRY